ncbi:family 20 glycosylhydrolase [Streptomyces sp. NPDC002540]
MARRSPAPPSRPFCRAAGWSSPLPETRAVLATLLEEIADAVDSPYLHIGGDEADLSGWERSADVRAYAKGRGLDSVEELRADLTTYVVEVCARLGRRAVVWEEAARAGGLRPDSVVMVWRAERNAHPVLAAGHDVVMAPIASNYLDHAEDGSDEPLALGTGRSTAGVAAMNRAPCTMRAPSSPVRTS